MMFSAKKRFAAAIAGIVTAMGMMKKRQDEFEDRFERRSRQIEEAHNRMVDILNALGERFNLEWDEKEKTWVEKQYLKVYEPENDATVSDKRSSVA